MDLLDEIYLKRSSWNTWAAMFAEPNILTLRL